MKKVLGLLLVAILLNGLSLSCVPELQIPPFSAFWVDWGDENGWGEDWGLRLFSGKFANPAIREVTFPQRPDLEFLNPPAWTADGKMLALSGYPIEGGQRDIFVYDRDLGETKNVTQTPERDEFGPQWNRNRLVFSISQRGVPNGSILAEQGDGRFELIASHSGYISAPRVKGGIVAYSVSNLKGEVSVFTLRLEEGSLPQEVAKLTINSPVPPPMIDVSSAGDLVFAVDGVPYTIWQGKGVISRIEVLPRVIEVKWSLEKDWIVAVTWGEGVLLVHQDSLGRYSIRRKIPQVYKFSQIAERTFVFAEWNEDDGDLLWVLTPDGNQRKITYSSSRLHYYFGIVPIPQ